MHSTTFVRAVMAAIVLLCCAVVALKQGRARTRPQMVTELVSVVYIPARPAAAASAPAAASVPAPASTAASAPAVESAPERAKAATPAPVAVAAAAKPQEARPPHRTMIAATRAAAGRVVTAAARPKPSRHAPKKHDKSSGDTMVASAPPPVPAFLMPVRRLGFSLQRRLVQAGVLKVCAAARTGHSDDCVRPAPDS
jgi:hypothetical protein